MNVRIPTLLAASFLAGLAGGLASHFLTPEKRLDLRQGSIRATRFELVDEAGSTRAFIGTDNEHDTALVFLDDRGRERAKIGLWPSSFTPKLVMRGEDGKDRIRFHLSAVDERAMILLGDHERTRVHLGYHQNDTGTQDESWSLAFYDPHDEIALSEGGLYQDYRTKKVTGFFYFKRKDGGFHEFK